MGPRLLALGLWPLLFAIAPVRVTPVVAARSACPDGLVERPLRARALRSRLADDEEARAILGGGAFTVCFGSGVEASVTPDGTVVLPEEMRDDRASARVAHLLHHRLPGSPFLAARPFDCHAWVERTREEEDDARALETRILERAGLRQSPQGSDLADLVEVYAARCTDEAR